MNNFWENIAKLIFIIIVIGAMYYCGKNMNIAYLGKGNFIY